MAVARNADGRMEVFARGNDRALIHIWQVGPNNGWTDEWRSLGGRLQSVPAVGRNTDGRLEVFGIGDNNTIWHIWQIVPNGIWSGWNDLGVGGVLLVAPVVAHNADGRLEVFSIMVPDDVNEGMLYHKYQGGRGAGWSDWESLGRPPGRPPAALLSRRWDPTFPQFDVGRNADGRLEAFAVTHDGGLWHTWQNEPNSRRPWSAWAPLGSPPGRLGKAPVVARNSDGRLEVFAITQATHEVMHVWQTEPNNGWSGWHSLGGTLTSAPAVSRNADGRLEVFGRGLDKRIWHKWQGGPIDDWSDWAPLGNALAMLGPGVDTDGFPTVGQNADGRLQVFVRRVGYFPRSVVETIWQDETTWSEWHTLASWDVNSNGAFGRGLIAP